MGIRQAMTAWVFGLAFGFAGFAHGQDADYTLSLLPEVTAEDVFETLDVDVELDFVDGDDLQGYQWGICHDDDFVSIEEGDVVRGAGLDDVSFTFEALTFLDDPGAAGWTAAALLNVITGEVIEPQDDVVLYVATYSLDAPTSETTIEWCEGLGEPATTVRLIVSAVEIEPVCTDADIAIVGLEPMFDFLVAPVSGGFDPVTGEGQEIRVPVSILEDDASAGFPHDTQAFSFGLEHDGDLLIANGAEIVGELLDLDPDYVGVNTDPVGGPGMTVGVVYDLISTTTNVIAFDTEKAVLDALYEPNPVGLLDVVVETDTTVQFTETLGDPLVPLVVTVNSVDAEASGNEATVTLIPGTFFRRGDANEDGVLSVSDAPAMVEVIFEGEPTDCMELFDVDDNDVSNLLDIIDLLEYLFLGGAAPAAPHPDCGVDADGDCDEYDAC